MAYTKHIWNNGELPAINSTNLNDMENGIEEAHANFTNCKLKGDFAVITGEIECTTQGANNSKNIDYPLGFTKDNCVVISFGLGGQSYNFGYSGLAYGYTYTSANLGLLSGGQDRNIVLNDNAISINCYNPTNSTNIYTYKIVLMKILEEES